MKTVKKLKFENWSKHKSVKMVKEQLKFENSQNAKRKHVETVKMQTFENNQNTKM